MADMDAIAARPDGDLRARREAVERELRRQAHSHSMMAQRAGSSMAAANHETISRTQREAADALAAALGDGGR